MRTQKQALFWLAASLVALVVVLVLKDVLLPFIAGVIIAYALNPIADRLVRLGLHRTAAAALVVAVLVTLLVLALVFLVPLLLNQLQQLIATIPSDFERLKTLFEEWGQAQFGSRFAEIKASLDRAVADFAANWGSLLASVASSLWSRGGTLLSIVSFMLITPLVVFYLLEGWNDMLVKLDSWLPREHEPTIRRLATEMNDAVAAFIRGQGLICVVLGILYAASLSAIGIRYGLLIGLATGVLSFVPFVGWALGLIVAGSLAVVQFLPNTTPLLMVLGVFAAGQVLDAAILSPKIVGDRIGLHPVWLLVALAVFSHLFGLAGVLVAVPLAAAFAVLVRFALELYLSSAIYRGGKPGPSTL